MKRFIPTVLTLAALLQAAPSTTAVSEFAFPVIYDSLSNGLKYLIVRDPNVAVVSCRLYYFVGSMYEGPGSTGLSHMFEHMMFKGTGRLGTNDYKKEIPLIARLDSLDLRLQSLRDRGVPDSDTAIVTVRTRMTAVLDQQRAFIKKDEIWELYQKNGATNLNAWTADDMTAYIVTLPQNKVELFYWIESDRMRDPVLREFPSERDVVTEERRMRTENVPVNSYWERLNALFYMAHPYRNPTIGWMSDIQSYTREKLSRHVRRFYTPDNAVLVLNGNIDPKNARTQIARYFGSVPPAGIPKEEVVTREPEPIGQTRFVMHTQAQPRIDIMFHTPGYPHEDLYRLDVLEGVLSGRSGTLYKKLVIENNLCTDADAGNTIRLHDGYFSISAVLKEGADPAAVEKLIVAELDRLTREAPTADELLRVKNSIRMAMAGELKSLEGLSDRLAWFQRLGNWRDLFTYPQRIYGVAASSVPAVAKKYLDPRMATIGMFIKAPSMETFPSHLQPKTKKQK